MAGAPDDIERLQRKHDAMKRVREKLAEARQWNNKDARISTLCDAVEILVNLIDDRDTT